MDINVEVKVGVNGEVKDTVKDSCIDLDDLFRSPDAAFWGVLSSP